MKSVLLLGAFGHPNFGDDLILKLWMRKYTEECSIDRFVIDGLNNKLIKNNMDMSFVNCSNVVVQDKSVSLWHLKDEFHFKNGKLFVKNKENLFSRLSFISSIIKELGVAQIHICGGGYINSLFFDDYILLFICKLISNNIGIPVVITGNGLTPVDFDKADVLDIFSCLDLVDTRDIESYSLIKKINRNVDCNLSGDDALIDFTLKSKISIFDDAKKSFVICLQNDLFDGKKAAREIFDDECVDFISKNYDRVLFLSAMHHDVVSASSELINKFKSSGIKLDFFSEIDVLNKGLPFNSGSFFVTSRYHVHMIYSLNGMRGVCLVGNDYYKIKHSAVSAMGSRCPISSQSMAREYIFNPSLIQDFSSDILDEWVSRKNNIARKVFAFSKKPLNDIFLYNSI